ncbi:NADH-quinone oxidoreductase subunit M [Pseudactinotalea sp. HY160]|uniref:NADH-quinone oxidoreductase subunit M n=1 Tax=Pseudactinotalea sp. HY160 TaxID=2654490 RepID=UPI00128BD957|nr:NADH-quinone oxidoreductase subunit M [Pseudactinotalea sp. HY160]MPV50512.1 NADH-quinone oxidoreductase subunit M [Pseudactinotalea sp. HY160]
MPTQIAGQSILTLLILVPAVVALLIWAVRPLRAAARPIALVTSVVVLAGAGWLAGGFDMANASTPQFTQVAEWIPAFGASYAVGVTGLGLVMVLLAALLVPIVILSAWNEVTLPEGVTAKAALDYRRAGYMALILVLEALMIAIFVAQDVFFFYILFEAILIPIYFMIGSYGGPNRRSAAIKFLVYSLAGGLIMLVGVIALYFQTDQGPSAFLLENVTNAVGGDPTLQMWLFLTFFVAFAIKAPMVPVHTWLPDSAAQAPPGTSTLLVGVLDKVGTFGMIVLCLPIFPDASKAAAPVIIVLAVIAIIYGGIVAIGQTDVMRMIAFSSVSHFGFIVLGIFVGTTTALSGAMIYMVAHGLSIAGLFLISGFQTQRGGTQLMDSYGGMQRITPIIAGTWLISGFASLALPGLSGFVPEYQVLLGSFQNAVWIGIAAVIGIVLSALYILMSYQRIYTGPPNEKYRGMPDLDGREKTVAGVLIAAMLFLGFYPAPVLDAVNPIADTLAQIIGSAS